MDHCQHMTKGMVWTATGSTMEQSKPRSISRDEHKRLFAPDVGSGSVLGYRCIRFKRMLIATLVLRQGHSDASTKRLVYTL